MKILLLLPLLLLTGCYDAVELNKREYISSMIIKSGKVEIEGKSYDGRTVSEAIDRANRSSEKKLFFGHMETVYLDYDLLRQAERLEEALDCLERDKELSTKMRVMAGKEGKAENKDYRLNLAELLIKLRNDGNALIPNENGGAIIKDMTFAGVVSKEMLRGFLWQEGKLKNEQIIINYDSADIAVKTLSHKKKSSFYEYEERLVLKEDVKVSATIISYVFGERQLDSKKLKDIERLVEEEIKKEIMNSNGFFQKKLEADCQGLKNELKKKNYALWLKYGGDWERSYSDMLYDINVGCEIRGIGVIK